MKKLKLILSLLLIVFLVACQPEEQPGEEKKDRTMTNHSVYENGINYPDELWQKPTFYYDEDKDIDNRNIKAVWLRSDYQGQESYAFAYLGYPAVIKENMPAVLLLHGGGGTAYPDWVSRWTDLGYVALAVDLEGNQPKEDANMSLTPNLLYTNSVYPTPKNQHFNDFNKPIEETWIYYATKTAIIANSFLHNLDDVEKLKIGVVGVSWGGFIASVITGYDDRFSFSVPIYVTLNNEGTDSNLSDYLSVSPAASIFDNDDPLGHIQTPMLILGSNVDQSSRLDSLVKTYLKVPNGYLSIHDNLLHAQGIAADLLEPYLFATAMNEDKPYPKIITQPTSSKNEVTIELPENITIDRARLIYAEEDIHIQASYGRKNVSVNEQTVTFDVAEEMVYYYINILDSSGITTSSLIIDKNKE
ncbi:MAG: hypothetical protein WC225_05050 [Acholeplasmataceae bacterium]|nr:hypothetical protein [Acholeplasmataceae bacterium]